MDTLLGRWCFWITQLVLFSLFLFRKELRFVFWQKKKQEINEVYHNIFLSFGKSNDRSFPIENEPWRLEG